MATNTYRKSPEAKRPRMADVGPAPCTRCGGLGGCDAWPNFTCYRCGGYKADPKRRLTVREFPASWSDERCAEWEATKAAKDEARRVAAEDKVAAKRAAMLALNLTRCPALADESLRANSFVADLYWKAHEHELTDRQVAAVERIVEGATKAAEREAELDAAGVAVPDTGDRIEVVGTVRSVKLVEHQFGCSLKMLVEHESGWKVWGNAPTCLGRPEQDDVVRFVARVERSTDDVRFGFFSRPTKAEYVTSPAD